MTEASAGVKPIGKAKPRPPGGVKLSSGPPSRGQTLRMDPAETWIMHHLTHLARAVALAATVGLLVLVADLAPLGAAPKHKGRPAGSPVPSSLSGTRLDAQALARHIDAILDAQVQAEKVSYSPLADDAEFVRRVYLDITGHIPSADKALAFLEDRDPAKRAKLIDELLASSDYGKHQADIWQTLLLPRNSDNRAVRFDAMTKWLEENFNANKPWDRLVQEILTASGDTAENPPVAYFLANRGPDKLTDSATRLFLGVQLQCAQCHNHPFTDWKRDEYWGMAAFFSRVHVEGNPRAAAKGGQAVSIHENGKGRPLPRPDSAKTLPPKFLQGEQPAIGAGEACRPVLAAWMTGAKNPYFSKAMVNRTWAQLFGRGLVNPVDDMHEGNPPSHPQLLADLADQFAAGSFDLKGLIRALCNSKAYQRTSKPTGNNADTGPELVSRMNVKVLTPEQLFDSLVLVLGAPRRADLPRRPMGAANRLVPATPRAAFVNFFKVEDADPTEYQVGIPQALRLMNSALLNNPAAIEPLLGSGKEPAEIIESLYLRTLSRKPRPDELDRRLAYVRKFDGAPRQAYADILWALVNCSEFAVNH
jgi:hypothetical protein